MDNNVTPGVMASTLPEDMEAVTMADDAAFDTVAPDNAYVLSVDERDALGEVGNICMGTAATTLSTLLGKKVSITTPRVSICRTAKEWGHYQKPFLAVEVSYVEGIDGYNILLMKEEDVKAITDLLMGGVGIVSPGEALDEMHFSAICEVMNQMVGSSATSLSNILMKTVNISPPRMRRIIMEEDEVSELACGQDTVIKISFNMEIEGVLHSELMQIMPFAFGKVLAHTLLDDMMAGSPSPEPAPAAQQPPPVPVRQSPPPPAPNPVRQTPPFSAPQTAYAPPPPAPAAYAQPIMQPAPASVQSMQYQSFDDASARGGYAGGDNIALILDVPLEVTVELGQCKKSIKEVLSLGTGSVIVLDRLAGEMVDIMINGKLFARGEVVVIEDNYGVRVTEIIVMPQS